MTLAAGRLGLFDDVHAESRRTTQAGRPGAHASFASLKQIDAGALEVGYAEAGPANGPVVMLLHGWPYDIHTYVGVAPLLAAQGYRVIVPHVRGYGSTSFLSTSTVRNGQPSVIALDVMALMTRCASTGPSSRAATGALGPLPSSQRYGRNDAKPWPR